MRAFWTRLAGAASLSVLAFEARFLLPQLGLPTAAVLIATYGLFYLAAVVAASAIRE